MLRMILKVDISHISKFDEPYFNIRKHKMMLIFKREKLWPIVSGSESLPIVPTTAQIAVGYQFCMPQEKKV
jgi:hypothetical protein